MKLNDPEFRKLLDAYLSGTATAREKDLLDQFFASYEKELAGDEFSPKEQSRVRTEILAGIKQRIRKNHPPSRQYSLALPIAAVVTLFIVAFAFFISPTAQEEKIAVSQVVRSTLNGQKLSLKLPDGTAVRLNSGSSLQFPEQFDGNTREVTLRGEAYFEVVRDAEKPFIVHTEQAKTTVVGTVFNIKTLQGNLTEVTLVEGKVRVASSHPTADGQGEVILDPNQQAIVETGSSTITTRQVNAYKFAAWKDNILEFENATLEGAVEELKKWYGVDFELKNAEKSTCTINATYRNESLENVLKSFEYTLKINYVFTDGKVIIDGKRCK